MNAIEVKNVYKSFKIYYDKGATLKEKILFKKRNRFEEHRVLRGVDLNISKGEVVGLIGENGCGKSTLLKLMTRIIYPDQGSIEVQGKVSSLLELGAGFHPDMTGRENIYTNASIFGLSKKQIDQRLEKIIRFSELKEFIDNPVRTYSSGMYMRLAFSVAINVDADILLIDEILAVGDTAFQRKCFEKIEELKTKGKTIVIVSHDMTNLKRLCNTVYWIQNGEIKLIGEPQYIIDQYIENTYKAHHFVELEEVVEIEQADIEQIEEDTNETIDIVPVNEEYVTEEDKKKCITPSRWGNKEVEILSVKILDESIQEKNIFYYDDNMKIKIVYRINKPVKSMVIGFGLFLPNGERCYGTNTEIDNVGLEYSDIHKEYTVILDIKEIHLTNGIYYINIAAHSKEGYTYDYLNRNFKFQVFSNCEDIGIYKPKHCWKLK